MTEEEFRKLIEDAYRKGLREGIAQASNQPQYNWIPEPCKQCSNHPANGGSGVCFCTLGTPEIR